jgi:hypothetical protein
VPIGGTRNDGSGLNFNVGSGVSGAKFVDGKSNTLSQMSISSQF